jgi:organic hydroperoxide reductase OsmC/OhrA
VVDYQDQAVGKMIEKENGSGYFESAILKPDVVILESEKKELAIELHHKANEMCFIANSCNFEIRHEPRITVESSKEE